MYLLTVAPLSGTLSREGLSYYSKDPLDLGAIVEVPVRKKFCYAVVLERTPLKNAKSQLRAEGFVTKKIHSTLASSFLTEAFLQTGMEYSSHYALSPGQVFSATIPKVLLDNAGLLMTKGSHKTTASPKKVATKKTSCIQAPETLRFQSYATIAKKQTAQNGSVFIVVPDRRTGQRILETLTTSLNEMAPVIFLHSGLPKKSLKEGLSTSQSHPAPVVLIATPAFLAVPRKDIKTIILEREDSELYYGNNRPYLDMQTFSEAFAKNTNAAFIVGATGLSLRAQERILKKDALKHSSFKTSIKKPPDVFVEDTSNDKEKKKDFSSLSEHAEAIIKDAISRNKSVFIFALRKGVAGTTICHDCGSLFLCENCSAPMTLINEKTVRRFFCGKCGKKISAQVRCKKCNGYRLEALGIGIDRIHEELEKNFPNVPIFQIDQQYTSTYKKANEVYTAFKNKSGAILLGTEKALNFLDDQVEVSIVATMDTLYALPNFTMNEKIFSLLSRIAEKTVDTLLIQSRKTDADPLSLFLSGDIEEFVKKESKDRKQLGFPPYKRFIKITFRGKTEEIEEQKIRVEKFFKDYDPIIYPAFTEKVRGKKVMNVLLHFPADMPLTEEIKKRLKLLPLSYEIRIDPESIL